MCIPLAEKPGYSLSSREWQQDFPGYAISGRSRSVNYPRWLRVDKLNVVMAMAFGAFFLHERLTAREGIGGFFIAAGALILAWK